MKSFTIPAFFPCLFIILSLRETFGQNPALIADINTSPQLPEFLGDSWITCNNIMYMNAQDNNCIELWRTDGTSEGTYSISPVPMNDNASLNGIILYGGGNAAFGSELWKTDGTSEGTVLVKDIRLGTSSSNPAKLFAANGVVYFQATLTAFGTELWKSDGTNAGTVMVKDIVEGDNSSNPFYNGDSFSDYIAAIGFGSKLIFAAQTPDKGYELWITDGIGPGTLLVKDINPGTASSFITDMVNYKGAIYFLANDGIHGDGLWKTDGTAAGTILVKDFYTGSIENAEALTIVNNKLVIVVSNGVETSGLWVSNGTGAGTTILLPAMGDKDVESNSFISFGNVIYFSYNDGIHGYEPWITDGTLAGTAMVSDIKTGGSSYPLNFTKADQGVIFSAAAGVWSTNGTPSGTISLASALPEDPFFVGGPLTSFMGKAYLSSSKEDQPLWITDGTLAGTQPFPFSVISQTASSFPAQVVKISNDKYIVAAYDSTHGNEIWKTNGTSGATLLKDISEGPYNSVSRLYPVSVNGLVYFTALSVSGSQSALSLWRTDGTTAGTFSLVDLEYVEFDVKGFATDLNGIFYFESAEHSELWRSNGTVEGTYRVKDINPSGDDLVSSLTTYNGKIYLAASDGAHGIELWQSDGTENGTIMLKDIRGGSLSSKPSEIASASGKLYFAANDGNGVEPWISDGTTNGTILLKDINQSNNNGSKPTLFTASGSYVYFSANDISHGRELWRTDGTEAGTMLVQDLNPGDASGNPDFLTDVNGTLFFMFKSSSLMKTTGNTVDTLADFYAGSQFFYFVNVNGYLYFGWGEPDDNLWRSDGTECHTQYLDLSPGITDFAEILMVDGADIFLSLNSVDYGIELFRYHTSPIPTVEICNGFDDDCDGLTDEDGLTATIDPSGIIPACDGELVTLNASPVGDDLSYGWYNNGNLVNGANTSSLTSATLGGNVQVVISSESGCIDTSAITSVIRLPAPAAKITPQGSLDICTTGSIKLKGNSGAGYFYQWYYNNVVIPGATNKVYTAVQTGNYKLKVTNSNSCSKVSKKTTVFTSCKEINTELSAENLIIAYPNPFHSIIHVDLSQLNWEEEQVKVTIADVSGNILFRQNFSDGEKIDVDWKWSNGFYLLTIQGTSHRVTIPVVRE